jgi:hypothetical protein
MSFQTLRPQIKTLLENSGLFQQVSGTPIINFTGYPAAYVVQSDNSNDYNTNKDNVRVYAFIVRIFYSTKSLGVDLAIQRLETIVDSIIDLIDEDSIKSSATRVIGVNMPNKYDWINTFAIPSSFGEVEGQQLVTAELKINIKVIIDIT